MVFMGSVPLLTHTIHTGKKRKRKKRSEPPPLRGRWRKIREPQAEGVCGGMLCVCGSLTRHAPTIKKHLIAPQKISQNPKKGNILCKLRRAKKPQKATLLTGGIQENPKNRAKWRPELYIIRKRGRNGQIRGMSEVLRIEKHRESRLHGRRSYLACDKVQ